ncbi:MAG: DUF2255 family protein [Nitrolancea sp.]
MASFDQDVLSAVGTEREVELTTWGRKSGNPSRVILWIFGEDDRVFIRSGGGLDRDWPQNFMARGEAILHLKGLDVPVIGEHVTDRDLARRVSSMAKHKYQSNVQQSEGDEPLTLGESATFELFPK